MQRVSPTSRIVEQAINLLIATTLFGACYALLPHFLGTAEVEAEWEVMNARVADLEQQNRDLRTQNQATLREVESLVADEMAVEQRARDEFNMVYPDEVVIDLRAVNPPAVEAPAPTVQLP